MALGGIDEAGRGPVLGPLVVAAVVTTNEAELREWDVKDSKKIPPARRQRLARLIQTSPDCRSVVISLSAEDVDARRERQTLNEIEVDMFKEALAALDSPETKWFLDAADVDAARFGRLVSPTKAVTSEHGADDCYLVVGAASILAKTARDEAMAKLARRLERKLPYKLGSGYPSDPNTKSFLKAYVETFGDLPEGTRRSWKTAKTLLDQNRTLDQF
ncbi:MAG: ribonuclease HII [Thermoplasmatota archaeon]